MPGGSGLPWARRFRMPGGSDVSDRMERIPAPDLGLHVLRQRDRRRSGKHRVVPLPALILGEGAGRSGSAYGGSQYQTYEQATFCTHNGASLRKVRDEQAVVRPPPLVRAASVPLCENTT